MFGTSDHSPARRPARVPAARRLPPAPPRARLGAAARRRRARRPRSSSGPTPRTCAGARRPTPPTPSPRRSTSAGWSTDHDSHELRECRPGDITILLPARTSLAALESALVERDIPYRAENSSVVYTTTDIRHVMLALRAADDSTDELALVAALRTGLYGCSDVELLRLAARAADRGRSGASRPTRLPTIPVAAAIAHVRSLAERCDVVHARRPDRGPRRRTPAARRRARLARRARRVAPHPVRDRAGARVERRRRARPAALPGVGAPAGGREPHRRHDPARARLRRRADHDDPRRQGSRVPDHGRHRAHHRARRAVAPTASSGTTTRGRSPASRATRSTTTSSRSTSR